MPSLHIEHRITDLATWSAAYAALAEVRRAAGVVGERVRHPLDDDGHVVVDLDFESVDAAVAFLAFLRSAVWSAPERSPALAGAPVAQVLVDVPLA